MLYNYLPITAHWRFFKRGGNLRSGGKSSIYGIYIAIILSKVVSSNQLFKLRTGSSSFLVSLVYRVSKINFILLSAIKF